MFVHFTVVDVGTFSEPISDQLAQQMDDLSARNRRKDRSDEIENRPIYMRNDTRKLLQEFYIPFNEDLSQVLSKEQPVWRYTLWKGLADKGISLRLYVESHSAH